MKIEANSKAVTDQRSFLDDFQRQLAIRGAERRARTAASARATRTDEIATKVKALRAQKGSLASVHPTIPIARALKKFMAARAGKIDHQTAATDEAKRRKRLTAGDHLELSEKARQLADRLASPGQVADCIRDLQEEAELHAEKHRQMLAESMAFWYGLEGLTWLAWKKKISPSDWSEYTDFMDEAALCAFNSGRMTDRRFLPRTEWLTNQQILAKLKALQGNAE